jgi:hypothetical protein
MSKKIELPVDEIRYNREEGQVEANTKSIIPMTLEEKVLDYINKHPEGVKIQDMEEPLVEKRMKLGFVAKNLLDDGRVLKIETSYFPITRHER